MQIVSKFGTTTLRYTWVNAAGSATDVGTVTVDITDGNGSAVVSAGSATSVGTGVYTYDLDLQSDPNQFTVVWADADSDARRTQYVEAVGALLFSEADARSFKAKADAASHLKPLGSESEYPDETIASMRAAVTDDLERWTSRSWIPRYARVEFCGTGTNVLEASDGECRTADGFTLNRPGRYNDIASILSVTVDGETVDPDNVKGSFGTLVRSGAVWPSGADIIIEYVYGLPDLVNSVDYIALLETVDRLVPSEITDRALTVDTDYGTVRMVQPGGPMANVSRLPRVNAWVAENSAKVPFA